MKLSGVMVSIKVTVFILTIALVEPTQHMCVIAHYQSGLTVTVTIREMLLDGPCVTRISLLQPDCHGHGHGHHSP
jgi:hypothetical protein